MLVRYFSTEYNKNLIYSAKDIKSIHDYNTIEKKFQQQKHEQIKSNSQADQTFIGKVSQRSGSSCARICGSQSYGDLTEPRYYSDSKNEEEDFDDQKFSLKRIRSLDDGSISHASSFRSSHTIKEPLSIAKSSKFPSHNDGLMSTSKQREFDFSPNYTPYSRITSSPGMYSVSFKKIVEK